MRHRKTHRITAATLGAGALVLGLAACADGGPGNAVTSNAADTTTTTETTSATTSESAAGTGGEAPFATAAMRTADGSDIGTVSFTEVDGMVHVTAEVTDLQPGFRGFHVHGTGLCEPDSESPDGDDGDFMSAGGHLTGDAGAEGHGNPSGSGHAGDMPSLLVNGDGTATLTFATDRLTRELLLDDDGSAVMIHSEADNFAHIPERYAADGPDERTLKTGDAGDRTACGVVEEGGGEGAATTSETTSRTSSRSTSETTGSAARGSATSEPAGRDGGATSAETTSAINEDEN